MPGPRKPARSQRPKKQKNQPKKNNNNRKVVVESTAVRRNMVNAFSNNAVMTKARPAMRPVLASPYAMCRLNPFSGGSAMYPGGGNAAVIVVDHRAFADVRLANNPGSCFLRILPCAPFSAALHFDNGTSTAVISNNKVLGDIYGPLPTTATDTQSAWYPLTIMSEYDTTNYPGTGTGVPYGATKARITACGFRLMFTGITQLATGLISMTPGAMTVVSRETLPFGVDIRTNADALGTTIVANSSDAIQIDGDVVASPCTPQTITVPMCAGASGTLIQTSETLPFRPVTQGGSVMFADGKTTNYFCSTTGVRGGTGFYDESWAPIDIYIGSGDANTKFRLEVATCVEYQVETSSSVARFARKPPPVERNMLNSLESAITKMPSFGDLSSIEATANRLLPMVKAGASLAAKLAGLAL